MGLFKINIFSSRKPKGLNYTHDDPLVKEVISDPEFPYLVSFPRTGSHWLRMLMEYYFDVPSLVRIFKHLKAKQFTCYHTHDLDYDKITNVECRNCIYLYRKPEDTVYSILRYYNNDLNDLELIEKWSIVYAQHLEKWLIREKFTRNKLIITYEGLKTDIENEFKKICDFFNREFDSKKLMEVYEHISKGRVYNTVKNDQIIKQTSDYESARSSFITTNKEIINLFIHQYNQQLSEFV